MSVTGCLDRMSVVITTHRAGDPPPNRLGVALIAHYRCAHNQKTKESV